MARDAEKLAAQAERLRRLKKQARVTFRQIGDAVDVTERQAQRWLSIDEPSAPTPQNLKRLASYLGTTPDYIEYGRIRRAREGPEVRRRLEDDETQLGRVEAKLDRVLFALDAATEEEARQVREAFARLEAAAASSIRRAPGRSETPPARGKPRPS